MSDSAQKEVFSYDLTKPMFRYSSSERKHRFCSWRLKTDEDQCCLASLLPPELLTVIFGHLNYKDRRSVAGVCRAWGAVIHRTPPLDHALVVDRKTINSSSLFDLSVLGMRRLKFCRRADYRFDTLDWISDLDFTQNSPNLSGLDLKELCDGYQWNKKKPIGDTLFRQMPQLTELRLAESKIGDVDVVSILRNLTQLVKLELSHSSVTSASLKAIARGLPMLEELELGGCVEVNDQGIAYLTGCDGGEPSGRLPKLELLGLSGISLTARSLKYISLGQPTLRSLAVYIVDNVGDRDAVAEHLSKLVKLEELSLDGDVDYEMSDANVRRVFQSMSLLKLTLEHFAVSETAFGFIVESCPDLTCVYLTGNSVPPDERRWYSYFLPEKDWITDVHLQHLAALTHLRDLRISRSGITDAGLATLAGGQSIIDTLHLESCPKLSDEGMRHLARLAGLRELNICGSSVTIGGYCNLTEGGAKISTLNVHLCHNLLTNDTMRFMSDLIPSDQPVRMDDRFNCCQFFDHLLARGLWSLPAVKIFSRDSRRVTGLRELYERMEIPGAIHIRLENFKTCFARIGSLMSRPVMLDGADVSFAGELGMGKRIFCWRSANVTC